VNALDDAVRSLDEHAVEPPPGFEQANIDGFAKEAIHNACKFNGKYDSSTQSYKVEHGDILGFMAYCGNPLVVELKAYRGERTWGYTYLAIYKCDNHVYYNKFCGTGEEALKATLELTGRKDVRAVEQIILSIHNVLRMMEWLGRTHLTNFGHEIRALLVKAVDEVGSLFREKAAAVPSSTLRCVLELPGSIEFEEDIYDPAAVESYYDRVWNADSGYAGLRPKPIETIHGNISVTSVISIAKTELDCRRAK
jgi:hypothetical protein